MLTGDAVAQFREAIAAAGLTPPDAIEADGKLHRFPSNGKRGDDAGYYVLHLDSIPAGHFGCWRAGINEKWRADIGRKLSPVEAAAHAARVEAMRREREAEEARRHAEARELAAKRYSAARPADPGHPYLVAKGVKPHGIRQEGELLLVPMRDRDGLHSLQTIDGSGNKRFLTGGRVAGCYHSFGKAGDTVCIAEGYATGASIHEATGYPVAVAFNAGNLDAVARTLRAKLPDARIVLCADDDAATPGNPGRTKATEAARAIGGLVALPDFGPDGPEGATDFNDMAQNRGAEAVREAVERATAPDVPEAQPAAPSAAAADSGPRVELQCASDVEPEAISWLWPGWLAAGKLHILAGPAGTGKTTLAIALAATITSGGRLPDGSRAAPADVVIWSGEDGIADTLVPRLLANGANAGRARFVRSVADGDERRPFDPAKDTPHLALALARLSHPPALLIVDPIVSAVAGDSHKNTETRRALQPLVDLGRQLGCAILGISHFSKGTSGRDPVERVTGSIAFGALPRLVLAAVKTMDEDGKPGPRLFARAKANIGPDGGGFHYSLEQIALADRPDVQASRVLWGDPVEGEARTLLAAAEVDNDADERTMTSDAVEWLREYLGAGPMPADDATREARKIGHSDKAIRTARTRLGVKTRKVGLRDGWEWSLPQDHDAATKAPNPPEDAQGAHLSNWAPWAPSTGERAPSEPDIATEDF